MKTAFLTGAAVSCLIMGELAFAEKGSIWLETDYLLWQVKGNPIPAPLLTKASYADPLPGAIGQEGTEVLLGNDRFSVGWMNGFQISLGAKASANVEIEASYFLLPTATNKESFTTSGEPQGKNFAVPIFDVTGVFGLNGSAGETIFILPGPLFTDPGFSGIFDFSIDTKLQGVELLGLYPWCKHDSFCFQILGGFRWFQLDESLTFKAKTQTVPNVSFPAGFFNFSDRFSTLNNFLGVQVGIDYQYHKKKWRLKGELKGALGANLEQIDTQGQSRTSSGNLFFETRGTTNVLIPGGIFAQTTNSGTHTRNRFAYALQAHLHSGYKVIRNIEINLGYTFFWLNSVVRPGKQINRKINTTLTPLADVSRDTVGTGPGPIPFGSSDGAPSPQGAREQSLFFETSSFYLQGFDVGFTLEF